MSYERTVRSRVMRARLRVHRNHSNPAEDAPTFGAPARERPERSRTPGLSSARTRLSGPGSFIAMPTASKLHTTIYSPT